MNKSNKTFRDELLDMEKPNVNYKETYEKEIHKMVEKKLSVFGRVGIGLLAAIGVLVVVDFVDLLLRYLPADGISNTITYGFVLFGLILSLAWTMLTGYLVVCGRFGFRIKPSLVVGVGAAMFFFLIVARTFFMELSLLQINPQDWRVKLQEQLAVAIFFMLVFVGLYLILRALYRIEFRTREKLLEIEYRLADLAEKIESKCSE